MVLYVAALSWVLNYPCQPFTSFTKVSRELRDSCYNAVFLLLYLYAKASHPWVDSKGVFRKLMGWCHKSPNVENTRLEHYSEIILKCRVHYVMEHGTHQGLAIRFRFDLVVDTTILSGQIAQIYVMPSTPKSHLIRIAVRTERQVSSDRYKVGITYIHAMCAIRLSTQVRVNKPVATFLQVSR